MLCEVLANARPELVLAEILLKHADNRRPFFVGEDVEHSFGIGGGDDGVLNWARARKRIGVECGGAGKAKGRPTIPLWAERIGGVHFHEGGEGFVEPNSVPPFHGDEIAEPHVGKFVVDDVGDVEEFGLGGRCRVDE